MTAKLNLFLSYRDLVVTSTLGYSIEFKKGIPTHVPKAMIPEVLEKGILPCDDKGISAPAAQVGEMAAPAKPAVRVAPDEAEERRAEIARVIAMLAEKNSSDDFTAGGAPKPASVTAALGWPVDAKEIRPLWQAYQQAHAKD
jgi:hypothetical protein